MGYEGAITIDRTDPYGDIMDVAFVVNNAFDKKNQLINISGKNENSVLEALQRNNVSSAFVEMRKLNPKKSEATYLYNLETNIRDKKGNKKYQHAVKLSGRQLQLVYQKGQDAVMQNEDKNGISYLMLGCKCKVGEVADKLDAERYKEWEKNGRVGEKPAVRSAGLYPRFYAADTFGVADVKLTENTLEKLNKHEKRFWTRIRSLQKEEMMRELEETFSYENDTVSHDMDFEK